MKKVICFLSFLVFFGICFSQEPVKVLLTFNKTVHIFFPVDVYYYDVGIEDILVQQKNAILKLAPKKDKFEETNLTVITVDNTCYTFLLNYSGDITELNYFITKDKGRRIEGALVKASDVQPTKTNKTDAPEAEKNQDSFKNDSGYISTCREIIKQAPSFWDVGASSKKIFLALNNIYINNEKLYFVVSLGNNTNINYDIDFIKLSVVNKKKLKKSSIQEDVKEPLFVFNNITKLQANTKDHFMVFVYDKFTIPENRKLVFEMYEKKGGRNISFDILKDLIINAKPIN